MIFDVSGMQQIDLVIYILDCFPLFLLLLFSCPVMSLFNPMYCSMPASLSLTIFQSLLKFMFIASVMPSSYLILWCPLLLLPSIFPSMRDFSNESAVCIRWPKYWSFSISPSSEYSGLLSFKIHWFDLLAVQGTLRSLLQHCSLKASTLWHCAFGILSIRGYYKILTMVPCAMSMSLFENIYDLKWLSSNHVIRIILFTNCFG